MNTQLPQIRPAGVSSSLEAVIFDEFRSVFWIQSTKGRWAEFTPEQAEATLIFLGATTIGAAGLLGAARLENAVEGVFATNSFPPGPVDIVGRRMLALPPPVPPQDAGGLAVQNLLLGAPADDAARFMALIERTVLSAVCEWRGTVHGLWHAIMESGPTAGDVEWLPAGPNGLGRVISRAARRFGPQVIQRHHTGKARVLILRRRGGKGST